MKIQLLTWFLVPSISLAGSIMPTQSEYYYELGGASDLFVPPVNKNQSIKIGGDVDAHLVGLSRRRDEGPILAIRGSAEFDGLVQRRYLRSATARCRSRAGKQVMWDCERARRCRGRRQKGATADGTQRLPPGCWATNLRVGSVHTLAS